MTPEFLKVTKEFIFTWECVYKKGHYGDLDYVTWEDEDGDPGGVTKYGIDKRSHPKEDVKNLTLERALEIYWKEYWLANKCDKLPAKLAEVHFNACVNCGPGRAKQFLAVNNNALGYLESHEAFYHRLVAQKSSFKKFLKGWLNRTAALRKFLKL